MQLSAVTSLAAASLKTQANPAESDIQDIVESVQHVTPDKPATDMWRNSVLWVDDRPDNNRYERKAFKVMGLRFTLALSTNEALEILSKQRFAAIISDMERREGPREGYVLLDSLRQQDNKPHFLFMLVLMLQNIKQRPANMEGKEAPITLKSFPDGNQSSYQEKCR